MCIRDRANEVVEDVEVFFEEQRETDSIWADAYSFDTRIRRNIRLAEAPSYGQSIFQYSSDSNGAQVYRSLAQEVMSQTQDMQMDEPEHLDSYSHPARRVEVEIIESDEHQELMLDR